MWVRAAQLQRIQMRSGVTLPLPPTQGQVWGLWAEQVPRGQPAFPPALVSPKPAFRDPEAQSLQELQRTQGRTSKG